MVMWYDDGRFEPWSLSLLMVVVAVCSLCLLPRRRGSGSYMADKKPLVEVIIENKEHTESSRREISRALVIIRVTGWVPSSPWLPHGAMMVMVVVAVRWSSSIFYSLYCNKISKVIERK